MAHSLPRQEGRRQRATQSLRRRRPDLRSTAGLHRAGLHALADDILGHPARLDDAIEVILGDRDRLQQPGGPLHLLRTVGYADRIGDFGELLAGGERNSHLGGIAAAFAGVLPDGNSPASARPAIAWGLVPA